MAEGDVCFCCLEDVKDEEKVCLPCCGKYYCETCSKKERMRSFFDSRGCPLCRKTKHLQVVVEYVQTDFRITLEKDGNSEVYSVSDRCSRYISAEYVRAFREAIKLCSQTCEWRVEPNLATNDGGTLHHLICDNATEEKIDLIRKEFLRRLTDITCDYLSHIVMKYRRERRPPALSRFVAHSSENPAWKSEDASIKFTDHMSPLIRIDNVALRMVQLKGVDVDALSGRR